MALFPLFMELAGRKCVCIGGGTVATRRVEALLEFGAHVTVISPELDDRLHTLDQSGKISAAKRKYLPDDLEGAFLAIAATSHRTVNRQVHEDAVRRNIPVNVADSPEECTFVFPSTVKRGQMVIGITTSGSCPSLTKHIRERIEQLYPEDFGKVVEVLGDFRKKALEDINDPEKRRLAMEEMLNEAMGYGNSYNKEQRIERIESKFEVYVNEKSNQGGQP